MESQQDITGGASPEASSSSASSGTSPSWAYEKYFTATRPAQKPVASNGYNIDAIAASMKVGDEDELGENGEPLIITIRT
jgi:hypothetical protein